MSDVSLDLIIAGLTAVTLASRSLFLTLGERVRLPARLQHGLRYAPACALVALVVPQLVLVGPAAQLSLANAQLAAAVLAAVVMRARANMLAAMAVGMAAFVLLRALA